MTTYVQTAQGLIIPEAEFAEPAPKMGEIATTADGRDITRGYVDGLPLLSAEDYILMGRAGGNYEIYEQLQTDPQVQATLGQRKAALTSKEWEVVPGEMRGHYSKARAQQAADSLSAMLDDLGGEQEIEGGEQGQPLPGWDQVSESMLHGIFPGYAVSECLWARDGREVVLDRVKVKKARRFAFAPNGALRLLTSDNPTGEPVPRRKFWTFSSYNDNTDDPYGLGLAHWLYWPVLFKRNGIKFWMIFIEKFAQPTVVGKFPGSANRAEQDKLLSAVKAVTADAGLIIPDGMLIELLEAARTGTSDYVTLHDRMDAAINKVMLGHSASADATPGRLGGEDLAGEVRDDIIKADADRVCGSFNVGPARWLTFWNFGENVPPPKVWRRVQPEPDLKAQAERDQILYNIGFEPTDGYIKETYGDGFQRRADNTSQGDAAQPGQGAAQPGGADPGDLSTTFADAADAQSLIDAQGESDPGFQDATEQLLEPVLSALAEGLTPDEILGKLGDWYPQMNDAALQEILQRGIAAADAIGRLEVQNED